MEEFWKRFLVGLMEMMALFENLIMKKKEFKTGLQRWMRIWKIYRERWTIYT